LYDLGLDEGLLVVPLEYLVGELLSLVNSTKVCGLTQHGLVLEHGAKSARQHYMVRLVGHARYLILELVQAARKYAKHFQGHLLVEVGQLILKLLQLVRLVLFLVEFEFAELGVEGCAKEGELLARVLLTHNADDKVRVLPLRYHFGDARCQTRFIEVCLSITWPSDMVSTGNQLASRMINDNLLGHAHFFGVEDFEAGWEYVIVVGRLSGWLHLDGHSGEESRSYVCQLFLHVH
jgi:hypothetical protein